MKFAAVDFIELLEQISRKAGVELEIKTVNLPNQQSSIKKPIFEFQAGGSFRDLFQCLVLIENLPYQINFEEVQLMSVGASTAAAPSEKKEKKGAAGAPSQTAPAK